MMTGTKSRHPIIIGTLLYFLGVIVYLSGMYYFDDLSLERDINERLQTEAKSILWLLEDDMDVLLAGEMEDGRYDVLVRKLSEYAHSRSLKFLYVLGRSDTGLVNIVTSATEEEWREHSFQRNYEEFPEPNEFMLRALSTGTVQWDSLADQYGELRSLYFPFQGGNQRTFIACADILMNDVRTMQRRDMMRAATSAFFFLLCAVPLMVLTAKDIRAQREAERARELAEKAARAKSDFLSCMSHEMRTPMNAIMGMLSIARSATEIERKEYCLDRISEASQHLMGVINDILDTAKIESDKLELSYGRVDFKEMVHRVTNLISFSVNERRQKLVVEVDENIPGIITDGQRLAQVVANLLSNAVKFTPEEGGISLTAKKIAEDDGLCTIRCLVKDTGIGISDEHLRQLFRPFEQADGSINRKFGGTGLGLAISKRLVEMMGGRIWVESELGSGASFFFEISARRADEPQTKDGAPREELHAAAAEGVSDDNIFEGKRILIAEDVDINREIIDALLTHTGVEISFARNGAEAVDKFASAANGFDLILMDIHMPDVDGYEATRRIRASALPGSDTTPIIAMTANVFREDVERCLACGMNDHIGKPVDKDRVIAKLRTYLLQA